MMIIPFFQEHGTFPSNWKILKGKLIILLNVFYFKTLFIFPYFMLGTIKTYKQRNLTT